MAQLSNKSLLSVKNLDFDDIKADLKNYLSSQELFKDYNFDGAGLSILLDVLAYNTHHMSFYANMISNESFLDSCILRNSAVSLSKSLGYSPRSRRGAEVVVDIKLNYSGTNTNSVISQANSKSLRILKNELFTCNKEGINYFFYATETFYFTYEGMDDQNKPVIWARNVVLREGKLRTKTFVVNNSTGIDQRFIIDDDTLDDRSLIVSVRKSSTESEGSDIPWQKSTNIMDNGPDSLVYFFQEIYDGNYELYFGDGIFGRAPQQGNIIFVTYSSCSGEEGNGIGINDNPPTTQTFRYISSQNTNTQYTFVTYIQKNSNGSISTSFGGQEKESRESMKYYAPKFYETQNRAVTLNDYIAILQKDYSGSVRSIYAWGGEDNIPPEYGKVFVSVRPRYGLFLSQREKINMEKTLLESKSVVTVTPKVIDPDYLYISPKVNIKYEIENSSLTPEILREAIIIYIRNFGMQNLSAFEKNFYSSRMNNNIIDINESIKSSTTEVFFSKLIYPKYNTKYTYTVRFENSLTQQNNSYSIISNTFYTYGPSPRSSDLPSIRCYFKDDNLGKISLFESGTDVKIKDKYGTIDYKTGTITLNDAIFLLPPSLETYQIVVSAKPSDTDVFSSKNTILEMNLSGIEVNLNPISTYRI